MTSFKKLKTIYNQKNPFCESRKGFTLKPTKLFDIPCNKWICPLCRPKLKKMLYMDILRNVYIYDMQKHFVITSEGKKFRNICSFEESYPYMNRQWHKFLNVINYHHGKIKYIVLPRAQKDGYCHYHILTNKYLDWNFLNKKRKKYGLGYVSIQKNKDVAEYLNTDFFKEYEWFIPSNIRHYRSSREIKLNNYGNGDSDKLIFKKGISDEDIKNRINERYNIEFDFWDYYVNKSMIQHNRSIGINGIPIVKEPIPMTENEVREMILYDLGYT